MESDRGQSCRNLLAAVLRRTPVNIAHSPFAVRSITGADCDPAYGRKQRYMTATCLPKVRLNPPLFTLLHSSALLRPGALPGGERGGKVTLADSPSTPPGYPLRSPPQRSTRRPPALRSPTFRRMSFRR